MLFLSISSALAEESEPFELAITVPAETTLSTHGLRTAKDIWAEMFSSAAKSLDMAFFYAASKEGEALDPVLSALEEAGKRGVRIRVLLEKKFEAVSAKGIARFKAIPGLELRLLDFSAIKPDGIIHAKYFIVDDASAYVGSQNFDWRSLTHIHELGLRILDPAVVSEISAVFRQDWTAYERLAAGREVYRTQKSPRPYPKDRRAYLVASPYAFNPRRVAGSERELLRLIGTAKENIRIQLLDYSPLYRDGAYYPPIDVALRTAAARGVQIKLLVSHWNTSDKHIDHLKSLHLVPNIEVRVATVPPSSEGPIPFSRVIHSKYMTIDGKTLWIGTSNWQGGYLDRSRNLEVVIHREDLAQKGEEVHRGVWDSPYAALLDIQKQYPKPVR